MPNKEEVKKVFTQILEPFALGLLALFFILPIITVMNLTPVTKQLKKIDVLGITTQDDVIVRLVEGKHEIFSSESLTKIEEFEYSYSTRIAKRAADSYSKPILEIENRTENRKTVMFWGQTLSNTRSAIYIKAKEKTYTLQEHNGNTREQEIYVLPGEKLVVFLGLENLSGVQFSEIFDMTITIE
jgi:hypothetical protein